MRKSTNSRYLSLVLRHKPEEIGLTLDTHGWANVADLISCFSKKGKQLTVGELESIVENNNKKRFEFNEDQSKIRARQGHSVQVDLGYVPVEPPAYLYHGTATRFLSSIVQEGLQKRSRHHVHLSLDKSTATQVGSRHGKVVILVVHAQKMHESGHRFFRTDNGVWLTDYVPIEYITFP